MIHLYLIYNFKLLLFAHQQLLSSLYYYNINTLYIVNIHSYTKLKQTIIMDL